MIAGPRQLLTRCSCDEAVLVAGTRLYGIGKVALPLAIGFFRGAGEEPAPSAAVMALRLSYRARSASASPRGSCGSAQAPVWLEDLAKRLCVSAISSMGNSSPRRACAGSVSSCASAAVRSIKPECPLQREAPSRASSMCRCHALCWMARSPDLRCRRRDMPQLARPASSDQLSNLQKQPPQRADDAL